MALTSSSILITPQELPTRRLGPPAPDPQILEITATDLHDQAVMTQHFRRLANYLGDGNLGQLDSHANKSDSYEKDQIGISR